MYSTLKRKLQNKWLLLRLVVHAITPMVRMYEKEAVRNFAEKRDKAQPVFILGAPRSGTTILYQVISHYFDILYLDNLMEIFRKIPYFGFWVDQMVFSDAPHGCFQSEYGTTARWGLHAPSQAPSFWWNWLPKDKTIITREDISDKVITDLHDRIYSIINRYNKPILFKELRTSFRLDFIHSIAPNAKFIVLIREPLYLAQSIIKSKEKFGLDWGLEIGLAQEKDIVARAVKQVYTIYQFIFKNISLFPSENYLPIHYDLLGDSLERVFEKILTLMDNKVEPRTGVSLEKVKEFVHISQRQQLDNVEFDKLRKEIEKYNWDFLHEFSENRNT